jgi:hypothetical protein
MSPAVARTISLGVSSQRPVRAGVVVVALELAEDRPEVRLVQNDQVVEALAAQRADESFGDRVRPRRPHRREHGRDAQPPRPEHELAPVDRVAVPHEVARHPSPGRRLDQLPPDPRGGRAGRDVQVLSGRLSLSGRLGGPSIMAA